MKKPDPAPFAVRGSTPYGAFSSVDVAAPPETSVPEEEKITPASVDAVPDGDTYITAFAEDSATRLRG